MLMLLIYGGMRGLLSCSHTVSQTILSAINAYIIIIGGTYIVTTGQLSSHVIKSCCYIAQSFYVSDTILCIQDPKQWVYIPHHVVSYYLARSIYKKDITPSIELIQYVLVIEYSNALLPLWDACKDRVWYVVLVTLSYIPLRSAVAPFILYNNMSRFTDNLSGITKKCVVVGFGIIQLISWIHSVTVFRQMRLIVG